MTAEVQQPQGQDERAAAGGPAQTCSLLLSQLKEITGIHNPQFLRAALKDESPQEDADLQEPVSSDGQDFSTGKKDFAATRNAQKDLLAVAAVSVSGRARELSVAENKNRSKRKRCEVWGENTTQRDWRRVSGWPVGMKNIGNTCWFSAVIQLPEFRHLVLNYSLPEAILDNCRSRNEKRNIAFMQELQYLFALMLGTHRKFVDPATALELLKGAFRSPEEQQQDVSEFTHKLLDWLEDAFQLTVEVE
ncbi:hypothetical protein Chor_005721 [Crotalus horridus]